MQEKIELLESEARRFYGIALTERNAKFYNDLGDLLARVAADLRLKSRQGAAGDYQAFIGRTGLRLVGPPPGSLEGP